MSRFCQWRRGTVIAVQLLDLSEKNMEPSNNDGIVAMMDSILGLLSSETEALCPVDTQHLSSSLSPPARGFRSPSAGTA